MPQYKKVFDIGTYTGNGGQYRVGIPTLRGVGPSGKQVAGSLRFRAASSTYLTRTPASATNQTTWTWSGWVKRTEPGSRSGLFSAGSQGPGYPYYETYLQINENDNLLFISEQNPTSSWIIEMYLISTTKIFKDSTKWYHIVCAVDTTQATAANRVKLYVDGQQIKSFSTETYPSQNTATYINTTKQHVIGTNWNSGVYPSSEMTDGYMSETYFVDGQALTPSSFGEYNSDGIWVPKAYSGTYGTNGFYLPMNSSSNYVTDQSGNGNNWTPTGFNVTTSNTSYDLMTDSPTDYNGGSYGIGNYCTMNSLIDASGTAPNSGSLNVSHPQNDYGTFSTIAPKSGRWWAECTVVTGPYIVIGVTKTESISTSGYTNGYLYQGNNGYKAVLGSSSAYGSTYTTGDVIGIDLNIDAGTITFYKQTSGSGSFVSQGAISIASNTNGYKFYSLNAASNQGTMAVAWNFGQRAFNNSSIPSGALALTTYNITRPADSSLWFYGDTPDLMWIKNRTTTGLHVLTDTVRGMGLGLTTVGTVTETSYPGVTEMNKFGMTIINDSTSILNGSTNSHVYWAWKAGSNTSSTSVTNTDGTITSQVSANRQAGFSIVGYTGTGANATVGHGLGVVPNMVITRNRSLTGSTPHWAIYHSSLTSAAYVIYLDLTNAEASAATQWNSTAPTSSVFSVGTNSDTNGSGNTMVAYCWSAIPGYSAFGSYTGNGSTDGPFVYLGFRPKWLLVKCKSSSLTSGAHWVLMDTTRYTYNPNDNILYPNLNNSEGTAEYVDILSNGFKIRTTTTRWNNSGDTFIYAAFAEIPFKFARAR